MSVSCCAPCALRPEICAKSLRFVPPRAGVGGAPGPDPSQSSGGYDGSDLPGLVNQGLRRGEDRALCLLLQLERQLGCAVTGRPARAGAGGRGASRSVREEPHPVGWRLGSLCEEG